MVGDYIGKGEMPVESEKIRKIFDKYVDSLRTRSVKWWFKGDSKRADKKIEKYIKYFCLPIRAGDVIALLDTTVFRTAKEGCLFTNSGILVKEVVSKLYYLEFSKIERAEVLEETDEYYRVKTSVWVYFTDGTKKQIFDYYFNKYSFVDYINDVVNSMGTERKNDQG